MVYEDCKYRMPCGWCDRHNRLCDVVQYHLNQEKNDRKEECEHNWKFELKYQYPEEPERWYNKYFCPKCGTSKVLVEDVIKT